MKNLMLHRTLVFNYCLFTFVFLIILQVISASTVQHINEYTTSNSQTLGHISELDGFHSQVAENISIKAGEKLQRHRRYITVNIAGQFNVGFLIVTPIIIIVPYMSNLFNKWRIRRDVYNENEHNNIEVYNDTPAVQNHLNKIATYFNLLEIPETACHIRATCEFSAEPEMFYPISSMILRRLRDPILPAFLSYSDDLMEHAKHNHTEPKSLFKIYNQAADIGQAYGVNGCQKEYGNSCRYSINKLLNMPVLRFWRGLGNMLKLSFTDDDET